MKKIVFALVLVMVFAAVLGSSRTVVAESKLDKAIHISLNQLQGSGGVSITAKFFVVVSAQTIIQPNLTYEAYRVKILESPANIIHTFWYDAALKRITEEQAFAAQASAYENFYGRLDESLYALLKNSNGTTEAYIPVAIWANQPMPQTSTTPPVVYPNKLYLPYLAKPGAVEEILIYLSSKGYQAEYVSNNAPVIYATIPFSLIYELASKSFVAAIYEQTVGEKFLESAARTTAAPWTWERGITGSGVKVAVLEDDGIAFDNPYLAGSRYYIEWSKRVDSHATEVAGVLGSAHNTQRGIAYGAEIVSANALSLAEPFVIAASDWAIEQGVDIINASFGTICGNRDIQSIDKYFDWVVWNKKKTVTVSSGNLYPSCASNYNVSSPGKAYNVITVGAKDDRNTATTTDDVKDDIFSYFSLYIDPVTNSENRLKPEVVAPGQQIQSTSTTSPWITDSGVNGTSFSAPIVAGEAALMMQRTSWLKYSPEAVKAGIMSTARWTYLHDDKNYNEWASVDKMGVGSVDVTAADNSLINNRTRELYLQQNEFIDNHHDIIVDGCPQGERFRTVITWPSHPSRAILNWILHDRLESDFDLTVQSANGQIFGSYADEANYEIVEFNSPQTGSAIIRIHLSRWDNNSMTERIGLSYYCGSPLD